MGNPKSEKDTSLNGTPGARFGLLSDFGFHLSLTWQMSSAGLWP
jgi:hypothetical protein